jgi:hypothetical protein
MRVPLLPLKLVNQYAGPAQFLDLITGYDFATLQFRGSPTRAKSQVIRATIETPGEALEEVVFGQGKTHGHEGMRAREPIENKPLYFEPSGFRRT